MNKKKAFCFLLAVILLIPALLAGCHSSSAPGASATPKPSGTSSDDLGQLSKHMDISVGMWQVGTAFPENGAPDAVRDYIYNKLNITIIPMNFGWGDDAMQIIQIWSASNQLPDIVAGNIITTGLFAQWINQGLVRQFPADLSAYPNVKQIVDGERDIITYPMGDPNGKVFCIPRCTFKNVADNGISQGFFIRKDWMQQAGITKIPANMDEFKQLLRAYVKMGKIGLTCYNAQWIVPLMNGYEPGVVNNTYEWIRQDGKWVPAFLSQNILPGLKNIKEMLNEGLIDKDFALLKADEGYDKFFSGKAGAIGMSTDFSGVDYFKRKYDVLHPNSNWNDAFAWVPIFPAGDGQRYADTGPGFWSESYISAKVGDDKVDRILRIFEFFLSNEGQTLMMSGIQGVDYTRNADGTLTLITTKDANGQPCTELSQKYPACGLSYFAQWAGDNYFTSPKEAKVVAFVKPQIDFVRANYSNKYTDYRLDFLQYPDKDKLTANFEVDMLQAIMSDDIDAEWAAIVQSHLDNGYDKIIAEVNSLAEKYTIR